MAVPGWPLPTFCTASAARTRAVSTARWSNSVHSRSVVVGLVLTLSQGSSPHVTHVECRRTESPTGRCRAYPRENAHFFESFQTAGPFGDPPPDWADRHLATEYAA